jgi:CHAT domain-containing protein/Tfp pilus assembly protein PilF
MSSIFLYQLNVEKANHFLKKSLKITREFDNTDAENTYFFLFNIGRNYYTLGDYNKSLDYYHQAKCLLQDFSPLPTLRKAELYNNIGLNYYKLGNYPESQNYINESIAIKRLLGLNADLASNYNNLALIYQKRDEYDTALHYFNKSLYIYDSISKLTKSAFIINNIGNLYLQKKSFDSSKIYYSKALSIRKKIENSEESDLVVSLNNMSVVFTKLNVLDSSLFYNNLALNLNIKNLNRINKTDVFSITNYLITISDRIELNLKKFQHTNDQNYLTESFTYFFPTIKLIVNHLMKYNSIFSTNIFVNEYKRFFDSSIVSTQLMDSINPINCPRTLVVSEVHKSLSILNLPSELRNIQGDTIVTNHTRQLNRFCQWQLALLDETRSSPASNKIEIIDSLINNTPEIDNYYDKYAEKLKQNVTIYFDSISDSLISKCNNTTNRLLIDYYVINDLIYFHLISNRKITFIKHRTDSTFMNALNNYPKAIKTLDHISTTNLSKALSDHLLLPINETLKLFDNITIIPDQLLAEIPFESLSYHSDDSMKLKYLVESKNIAYRFSVLNRNYSNIKPANQYTLDFFGIAPFDQNDSSSTSLNGSAKEILEVTRLFKEHDFKASCATGENATLGTFTTYSSDARILHLSTHSKINQTNAELSFLELFPQITQNNLFFPVLASLPLRNELLILNACETGGNLAESSTGFVSFIKGMANVTTHNYLCTLWKIYDQPSYLFIKKFIELTLAGNSYSKALADTKRNFINSEGYYFPIFWSTFLLYENN